MKRRYRFILSGLSGVLLSLAWLGFPGWTLFVAFIPLLYLDDFFVTQKDRFRGVSFFGHAWLTFLIWNICTTWWVANASPAGAAAAILLNSFVMALTWWLAHTARRTFAGNLGYLALIVFYLSFEFLHYHWDLEWPWLTLGNGFANNVKIVQWYEYTGVFGGSLWVLLVNVILFKLLKKFIAKQRGRLFYVNSTGLAFLIFTPMIISFFIYKNYKEKKDPREVVVVQPNIDPYNESYTEDAEGQKMNKFIGLATKMADDSTDLVVGPESIFERYPDWEENSLRQTGVIHYLEEFIQRYKKLELIFGVITSKVYPRGTKHTETAHEVNGVYYDIFNSAIFVNRKGDYQIYHKSILVPGVEKIPYVRYLKFLRNTIINLGGASGSFGSQKEPTNFVTSDSTVVGTAICYESIFGEYIAKFVRKGAQFIFIITNDGWWKDTPGYKQHMSFARLRAIETRRSIARAANTGISCFINQRGDVLQKTRWWVEASIKQKLNVNNKITFYVKYGDYIPRVAAFLSGLLILFLIAEKFRRKTIQQQL